MKRTALLGIILFTGACSSIPDGELKRTAFTDADTQYVTQMAMAYVSKHFPPNVCVAPEFRTYIAERETAGISHTDPVHHLIEIPRSWVPSKIAMCDRERKAGPVLEIGRPSFVSVQLKNGSALDISDVTLRFICGPGHLCFEKSELTFSRKSASSWKFEEFRRHAIGM